MLQRLILGLVFIVAVGCGSSRAQSTAPASMDSTEMDSPEIVTVDAPSTPSDDVPLFVHVIHADRATLSLKLELSLDGTNWKTARSDESPPGSDTDGGSDIAVPLTWHSLHDISFHSPQSVKLRITPSDRSGTGSPYALTLSVDNLRAAAMHVNYPLLNYSSWDDSSIAVAQRHDIVVLDPGNATPAIVQRIQLGADPNDPSDDVIVLGYVTIGEDDRTESLTDDQAKADPRFAGDGTGPRVDPRGPMPKGGSLAGINPLGNPSPGGTGWASYYLNDNSLALNGTANGIPDRNTSFGSYFVNAGDPKWFDVGNRMTTTGVDGIAGFQEVMTTTYGQGFGCDGVFLATLDTAAPNSWTSPGDDDFTQFEWTGPGMSAFVAKVRAAYPNRLILQNRGDFFLTPNNAEYAFTTRGAIDFFLFESYRLSSSATDGIDPLYFADNQYDIMPKLMAESGRPDGFRVLALGYAEGTGLADATQTLLGQGDAGLASFLEEIRITERVAGFREYLTNADVALVNSFVRDHSLLTDTDPPAWSNVWNGNTDPATGLPSPPTARVGIQSVEPGKGQLTVGWNIALDFSRVGYALYYSTRSLNPTNDPTFANATRVVLVPQVPAAYVTSFGADSLPYQYTLTGLTSGQTYFLIIRAFDAAANEDANTVMLSGSPL